MPTRNEIAEQIVQAKAAAKTRFAVHSSGSCISIHLVTPFFMLPHSLHGRALRCRAFSSPPAEVRWSAVRHARYYWLVLAEGYLNRRLFGEMLRRIWALPLPSG